MDIIFGYFTGLSTKGSYVAVVKNIASVEHQLLNFILNLYANK